MNDLNCPYCDAENEACHDDGQGYSEDERHVMMCSACGKEFVFYTSILFHYEPKKADCLNGSEHIFEMSHTWPLPYTKMNCKDCDYCREPTQDEWVDICLTRSKVTHLSELNVEATQ